MKLFKLFISPAGRGRDRDNDYERDRNDRNESGRGRGRRNGKNDVNLKSGFISQKEKNCEN